MTLSHIIASQTVSTLLFVFKYIYTFSFASTINHCQHLHPPLLIVDDVKSKIWMSMFDVSYIAKENTQNMLDKIQILRRLFLFLF